MCEGGGASDPPFRLEAWGCEQHCPWLSPSPTFCWTHGGCGLPLVGATLLARCREDCCKVHPSSTPGVPRRTGRPHCMAGSSSQGPGFPPCRVPGSENPGHMQELVRLGPRHVSTAILLETGEGNCVLFGQQSYRWETGAS